MYEWEKRNEAFGADLTLRAQVGQEGCDGVRKTLALEQAHDIVSSTTSPVVLNLLLLNFVKQVERLIKVASVSTTKICTLKQTNLTRFGVTVLIEQYVQLSNGVSRTDKLLLDEIWILGV